MFQISAGSTARKPNRAVRPSRPAVQLYNSNERLIEVAPTGPSCFSATVNGELLVLSSRQPLLDACRLLLRAAADPNSWVVMRHVGSDIEALRGKLGILAKLAVEDDRLGRPNFRRWRGPRSDGAGSPIAPEAAA
jgi:hypothetical protein